mmetsp:Transcript_12816/g.22826  ORF Transcript_12816/g.22826 Transcript_12816/m.22826 type:complete len:219 (-) Transcript_12816:779-1435(-)
MACDGSSSAIPKIPSMSSRSILLRRFAALLRDLPRDFRSFGVSCPSLPLRYFVIFLVSPGDLNTGRMMGDFSVLAYFLSSINFFSKNASRASSKAWCISRSATSSSRRCCSASWRFGCCFDSAIGLASAGEYACCFIIALLGTGEQFPSLSTFSLSSSCSLPLSPPLFLLCFFGSSCCLLCALYTCSPPSTLVEFPVKVFPFVTKSRYLRAYSAGGIT